MTQLDRIEGLLTQLVDLMAGRGSSDVGVVMHRPGVDPMEAAVLASGGVAALKQFCKERAEAAAAADKARGRA